MKLIYVVYKYYEYDPGCNVLKAFSTREGAKAYIDNIYNCALDDESDESDESESKPLYSMDFCEVSDD